MTIAMLQMGYGTSIIKLNLNPSKIELSTVVNFSAPSDVHNLLKDLIKAGQSKRITVEDLFDSLEDSPQFNWAPHLVRIKKILEQTQCKLPSAPKYLLCLLPERKNCDIYNLLINYCFHCKSSIY